MSVPKFFSMFTEKRLTKDQFIQSIKAGIGVAIISLPLSIALGISSGVTPQAGMITAIVAGIIVSILSGTSVQIGGPTGAFVVVVLGIVQKYGLEGLILSTFIGGIILILLGLFRLGSLIKYISYPITVGFAAGVAMILVTTEVKDFLGLKIDKIPSDFINKWITYITHLNTINYITFTIGIISILIIVISPKINKSIPGTLLALIIATLVVKFFNLDVATIGSIFGNISGNIPMPKLPVFSLDMIKQLINPAITIALLCAISSLLSAVISDEIIGEKHDSNTELIAQGFANMGSALFGGIPAAGVVARTTANMKAGGRTPIGGIVNGLVLLIIMLVLMPIAEYIPLTTLGAILLVVAYRMSKLNVIRAMFKGPKDDLLLLIVTFILTVIFNVVIAVTVGVVISAVIFMWKMSNKIKIDNLESTKIIKEEVNSNKISVYKVAGPLFFGSASILRDIIRENEDKKLEALILSTNNIADLDATILNMFEHMSIMCKGNNSKFIITGLNEKNKKILNKSIKEEIELYPSLDEVKIGNFSLKSS